MEELKIFIISLSSVRKNDYKKIGNKAANLAELIQNKFLVPNGFVIITEAYRRFLEDNILSEKIEQLLKDIDYYNINSLEIPARTIRDLIRNANFSADLEEEIKKRYFELGCETVAVRSSATAEDLPTASFAGQYDTYLNLKNIEDVLQCIKDCYGSLWTNRAIAYRKENNINYKDIDLAVIVQELIPASSAGVLFTSNPISFNSDEILIESNFGLGESIVSGISSPDRFIVKKIGKKTRKIYKIFDRQISKKKIAIQAKTSKDESGVEKVNLSEEQSVKCSLNDQQIIELAKLGIKVENSFGCPQDIEWAIDNDNQIQLLQSRPITTRLEEDEWFTRGYADDYWNDPVTPLFFDLLGEPLTNIVNIELNNIMGYDKMDTKLLRLHKAHAYFNLEVLKRKVKYEIPKFLRNEDLMNYFPKTGPYGQVLIKKLPFKVLKRLFAEIRIKFHDPQGSVKKTAPAYYKWTDKVFLPFCDNFDLRIKAIKGEEDLDECLRLSDELDMIMRTHYRLIRYGMPVHNLGMNLMTQYLLKKFISEEGSKRFYPILISGLKNKLTETNDELLYLASIIQESLELKTLILESDSKKILEYMKSERSPHIQLFYKEYEKFMKEFGDRGFTRETYYPRWFEAPEYVFDILKTLVQGKEQDFEKAKAKNIEYRNKIEKFVEAKIRASRFGILKYNLFLKILNNARKYIIFREDQRFNLDHWISRIRRIYLEIGTIFTKKGMLNEPNEIFFLHRKEIKDFIKKKFMNNTIQNYNNLVSTRKQEFTNYEHILPPKFLRGFSEFDDKITIRKDKKTYKGIPASQGIATAEVRVIKRIEDISKVKPGEILIVPRTDPGWTPIFSKIGGLVTETGGVLSHGAVVSREYGVPAVTNITDACEIFKTGQKISINGYNGIITLKK